MSLIILINGLISLFTGGLFYYYVNDNKNCLKRSKEIIYFLFGAHFVFFGFLGIKMAIENGNFFDFVNFSIFNKNQLFALLSLVSNIVFSVFMFNIIKIKKKENVVNNS